MAMLALVAMFGLSWSPFTPASWKPIEAQLAHIPAAADGNVLGRAKACHLHFRKSESWMGPAPNAPTANATGPFTRPAARPGDTVMEVYFDAPHRPDYAPEAEMDLLARWILRKGQPIPDSDWARALQSKPAPIGVGRWMPC